MLWYKNMDLENRTSFAQMNHLPSNRISSRAVTKQVSDILPSIKLAENEPTMKENYFLKP